VGCFAVLAAFGGPLRIMLMIVNERGLVMLMPKKVVLK